MDELYEFDDLIWMLESDDYSPVLTSDKPLEVLSLGAVSDDDESIDYATKHALIADLLDVWNDTVCSSTEIQVFDDEKIAFSSAQIIDRAFDNSVGKTVEDCFEDASPASPFSIALNGDPSKKFSEYAREGIDAVRGAYEKFDEIRKVEKSYERSTFDVGIDCMNPLLMPRAIPEMKRRINRWR